MARLGMLLGAVAALHLAASDSLGGQGSEPGTCLLQLGQSRGAVWPDLKLALIDRNSTEHGNSTEEEAARAPAAVPLAVKVQGTARNGSQKVLLGPAWALLAELHVPMRLRDLHTGPYGPMRNFVDRLAQELSAAGPVSASRLVVLDVRGENKNFSLPSLDLLELNLLDATPAGAHETHGPHRHGADPGDVEDAVSQYSGKEQETIVDIEILPMEHPGDLPPAQVFDAWQQQLADGHSLLRQGHVAKPMDGATLTRVGPSLPVNGSENEWAAIVRNGAAKPMYGLCSAASIVLMMGSLFQAC
mmetsp:Transcript_75087/g.220018  ORF Transcript_75087/g.220018 Transcript_75087/m.220018 type:complete len:302 (+) Transcript_75087:122-1027(+)